jgi:Protein of unknown function (DUF3108)
MFHHGRRWPGLARSGRRRKMMEDNVPRRRRLLYDRFMTATIGRLLTIAGLIACVIATGARAADMHFSLYSLGVPVAESTMTVDIGPNGFRMGLSYHTTGVARMFSGDKLQETVTGHIVNGMPEPESFRSFVTLHGKDRTVSMTYRGGDPTITVLDPPNAGEREEVSATQTAKTLDPLTALASILAMAARTGRCEFSRHTFDGRRLEFFYARTGGEEDLPATGRSIFSGKALRCDYVARTEAGFLLNGDRPEDSRPRQGTIWLAHLTPSGPLVPVHGEVDTRFLGRATMYLTSVDP